MIFRTKSLTAAMLAVAAALTSHAAFLTNATGIASPAETIDFSEVTISPDGTPLTDQFASFGATFQGMFYNTIPISEGLVSMPLAENVDFSDPPVINFTFSILFSELQTDAAFNLITVGSDQATIEAFLGADLVDSGPAVTNAAGDMFYGFSGATAFDRIQITITNDDPAAFDGEAGIDNLQLGKHTVAVPGVPDGGSTAALLGLAAGAVALGARRLKK
jgi:hypothetical protein